MNVLPVLDAVLTRLREKLPQLQVEYFPEKPAEYRLNHPVGALLVSYAGRASISRMISVRCSRLRLSSSASR